MSVPEIFDGCPKDIWEVSRRYFIGVLEILYCCTGEILLMSLRYFIGLVKIFDVYSIDIW